MAFAGVTLTQLSLSSLFIIFPHPPSLSPSLFPSLSPSLSQSRITEQAHYHTHDVTVETKKEPLTVMVDGDSEVLIENVIR